MARLPTPLSRRQFLLRAGALGTTPMLMAQSSQDPTPVAAEATPLPVAGTPAAQPVGAYDLAIRWRHLETHVHRPALIAAWPFDEGSGYAFADVAGNGHTLYITGSAWNTRDSGLSTAFHRRGRRCGGVYLDGTRWLQARAASDFDGSPALTVACGIRPDKFPMSEAVLLSNGDAWQLTYRRDGSLVFTINGQGDASRHVISSGNARVGAWTHVLAVADPATGRLALFLDGEPAGEATGAPFALPTTTEDLFVGRGFTGLFDEVTLHREALDQAAIARLAIVGLPRLYTQTRETIDADKRVWTGFKGSEPVPHPREESTVFTARYDLTTGSEQGVDGVSPTAPAFVPASFGAGLRADGSSVSYASPLAGDTGTFEAWYETIADPADPGRLKRKELFRAEGTGTQLTLYTRDGRWCVDVDAQGEAIQTVQGVKQSFIPGLLEHVAVSWGNQGESGRAVALSVNGVEVARHGIGQTRTVFDQRISLGGSADAPAFCVIDDVRISAVALSGAETCPRGQATTDAAGLDLRDRFDRPPDALPMWWRPGSGDAAWTHQLRHLDAPNLTGDDPDQQRSLYQDAPSGFHPIFHPDAYGHASSIEAGVSFPEAIDGWAGVFVQSSGPAEQTTTATHVDGYSFAINPWRGELRLARHDGETIVASKGLPYDFPTAANITYELTLTAANNGVLRGYVDGKNLISMRLEAQPRTEGFAGLFTDDARAFFDDVHFCALTPAKQDSRLIEVRLITTASDISSTKLSLEPFRWHKRRGLVPWQYTTKNPELAGNIAGADTKVPERPIPPAFWRAEDSANSNLVILGGRVIYFMRGNPRVDEASFGGRIGVLETTVERFDGIHFDDTSRGSTDLDKCNLLQGRVDPVKNPKPKLPRFQINEPASAYLGDGRLLVFVNEKRNGLAGFPVYKRLAYSYYELGTDTWLYGETQYVPWSAMDPSDPKAVHKGLNGGPELVALRDPDTDEHRAVLFYQSNAGGRLVMAMTGLVIDAHGVPQLDPAMPPVTSIGRASGKAIYSLRVLFDNGIYYLHYVEGPQVPDWPDHFVLAATLDPYRGPWVINEGSVPDNSTYFHRGTEFEPDNGAIWGGTMVKHRGRYHLYYENFHAIDDINQPYQHYNDPQAGSRVGYATAN